MAHGIEGHGIEILVAFFHVFYFRDQKSFCSLEKLLIFYFKISS